MADQKLVIRTASRQKAFLKLGVSSPSGGGKTMGSLILAYGMMKEKYPDLPDKDLWGKIVIIDSENGSGELYVNKYVKESNMTIGEYAALTLVAPFEPSKYTQAIKLAEESGFEVVIVDSLTHMWAGVGGALEKQGKIADRDGNSWTAWRKITPEITGLIDTILQTPIHVICTMRSKTEHVQEKNSAGITVVRKIGLNPVIRDGMEYEFTIFLEISAEHTSFCSKDRTGLLDGQYFTITPEQGKEIMEWLESGTDDKGKILASNTQTYKVLQDEVVQLCKQHAKSEGFKEAIGDLKGTKEIKTITDVTVLEELKSKLEKLGE